MKATELFRNALVVDMTAPGSPSQLPLHATAADTERWFEHYRRGGVTWASCTVAADFTGGVESTIKAIAQARRYFAAHRDRYLLIERADDIGRAKRDGRLAVSLHFQGTMPVGTDLALVELYKRLGVVHMLMAYNNKNLVGDGCHERTDAGLSRFGIALVEEMNRVGMLVDVTHTGHRTAMDVVEVSKAPVILSHSNPKALFEHDRNVADELIRAVAKFGGVIGVNGVGIFLSAAGDDVSPEMMARQVEYLVQLVGPSHVGFGLDFIENVSGLLALVAATGGALWPKTGGYTNLKQQFASPMVIEPTANLLLQRGHSETDVRNILGENWLRVLRQVWG